MKQNKLQRWIWSSCMGIWMIFIFCFSAQPAEQSEEVSGGVVEVIANVVLSFTQNTSQKLDLETLEFIVRKMAHFIEYAMLGIFAFGFLGTFVSLKKERGKHALYSTGIASFYAATDEFHQLFVAGRSGQFSDVLLDTTGAITGVLVVIFAQICYTKITSSIRTSSP